MVKVFISDLESYVGTALRKRLANEEGVIIYGSAGSVEASFAKVAKLAQVRPHSLTFRIGLRT